MSTFPTFLDVVEDQIAALTVPQEPQSTSVAVTPNQTTIVTDRYFYRAVGNG
jgi:hypothetical protein